MIVTMKMFQDLRPGDRIIMLDTGEEAEVVGPAKPIPGLLYGGLCVAIWLPSGEGARIEMFPTALVQLAPTYWPTGPVN